MTYTEIKKRNNKKYYYRVLSVRKGKKVSKKRIYLGNNLNKSELSKKEKQADESLQSKKNKKINKELEKIKPKMIKILKENHIKRAGIFGSYALGQQKKNSDVDVLIEIEPKYNEKISLLDIIRLQQFLEKKLGKKIDLVEYSALHRLLKDRILKEEIRII